ncbi:MAG: 50S ribosomal protein L4 [Nitrospiraceae bacterium]|nr:50S ribosomal protein L4 [Nitrospiraceae bacterium]
MPQIDIKDTSNKVVGKMDLSERFAIEGSQPLMHEAVVNYLANQRQGTHATKTKGLVSGGGKKPWKQKHTGRARSGSSRSPLWRGGGTIFGPQPRDYSYELPKTARRKALFAALSTKIAEGSVQVIDSFKFSAPKTREMAGVLNALGAAGRFTMIVLDGQDENLLLSARNVPGLMVAQAKDLNIYDVLASDLLLVTAGAMKALEERPL